MPPISGEISRFRILTSVGPTLVLALASVEPMRTVPNGLPSDWMQISGGGHRALLLAATPLRPVVRPSWPITVAKLKRVLSPAHPDGPWDHGAEVGQGVKVDVPSASGVMKPSSTDRVLVPPGSKPFRSALAVTALTTWSYCVDATCGSSVGRR